MDDVRLLARILRTWGIVRESEVAHEVRQANMAAGNIVTSLAHKGYRLVKIEESV